MGYGGYSYDSASTRACYYSAKASVDPTYLDNEVFNRSFSGEMNIKGKIRESRDSEEHPNSFPIAIFLDVTGSMGDIPRQLITSGFPELMKKIMDAGVEHAQVCFGAVGDHEWDSAPIQVGQFETSDELQEKWLSSVYIEEGGGSNYGESYALPWYVAARHMITDSNEKRSKKGVLITVGDEPYLKTIPKKVIEQLFGSAQADVTAAEAFAEASKNWDIYHINVKDYSGKREEVQKAWKQLLSNHFVNTQTSDGSDVPDIIANIVIDSYKKDDDKDELLTDSVQSSETETGEKEEEPRKHLL